MVRSPRPSTSASGAAHEAPGQIEEPPARHDISKWSDEPSPKRKPQADRLNNKLSQINVDSGLHGSGEEIEYIQAGFASDNKPSRA